MKIIDNTEKKLTVASIISLLFALFLGWNLFEQIVPIYVDDAMYSDWARHGFKYFVEKNVWHYNNFNGRFFVHAVMQVITIFNEHLYAVLMPTFIAGIAYLAVSLAKKDWKLYKKLFATSVVLLIFLGLTSTYLTSVLWMAGGFNYVFPYFIILIFYTLFAKYRHKNSCVWWLCIFAFVCGATTEQFGMFTLGLITLTYFFDFIDTKIIEKKAVLYLLSPVLGILTIILSPGTLSRVSEASEASGITSLSYGYLNNFNYIGRGVVFALPAVLIIITTVSSLPGIKPSNSSASIYNRLLLLGFPLSIISFISGFFEKYNLSLICFTTFIAIAVIAFLAQRETRFLGMILLCGYGTFFMMSITTTVGYRTCIPFLLSFILIISVMLINAVTTSQKVLKIFMRSLLTLLLIACFISYIIIFRGFKKKNSWCQNVYDSLSMSSQTGIIELDFDETLSNGKAKFRYTTLFDRADLIRYYRTPFNIPDDVKINVSSKIFDVSNLCYDGTYIFTPAVNKDGNVYIPFNAFAYLPDFDSKKYIHHHDNKLLTRENGKQTLISENCDYITIPRYADVSIFISISDFCKLYEVDYTYDPLENTYFFNKK